MWALIINGKVVELTEVDPEGRFHPDLVWVACPVGTPVGSVYDGAAFHAPAQGSLAELKAAKWEAIKAERDRRIQHGGYKVGEKWFHSDTFSRTQQMGLVMLGANVPANLQWKTMDGSFVAMTQALAGQVFAAAAASDVAIFGAAEAKRTAMEASADPASFDFAGGWPVGFGE